MMNIYHITYSPSPKVVCLHFWGCNLNCRACLLKKEIYDCHLKETKDAIFDPEKIAPSAPDRFLTLDEVMDAVRGLKKVRYVILMGAEASLDPGLPNLVKLLHEEFNSHNILLTNGMKMISLRDIDEVVFSIKALNDRLHRDYTGKSNRQALKNFVSMHKLGIKMNAESILIPEYIDFDEIERIARFIGGIDKNIPYRIDAYLPVQNNPWRRPGRDEIMMAVKRAGKYLKNVSFIAGDEKLTFGSIRIV